MITSTDLAQSKLDSNLLVISPDRVSVPALIDKCFKMYEGEIQRAEIDAALEIEDGYRDLAVQDVMIDGSRVLQVVINLLTNAVKFTQYSDQRKITVFLNATSTRPATSSHGAPYIEQRANRVDPTSGSEWGTGEELFLQICVTDSGKGIGEEELKLLFHRFSQASPKTYKQYGGSGLGLFISRELAELCGGGIGVYSNGAQQGSTFAFYVKARRVDADKRSSSGSLLNGASKATHPAPLQPLRSSSAVSANGRATSPAAAQTLPPSTKSPHAPGLHVLVVEDNEINQRVMATQLRRLGCTVHIAQHGLEALSFVETTTAWSAAPPAAIPLSVILMDLEMPVLGGLETVSRIRALEAQGKLRRHVPVIAVTANARSEQIANAMRCGMDLVVTKPFRIPELLPQMEALVAAFDGAAVGS